MALVKLYPSQFTSTPTHNTPETEILWEEHSTKWINITDVYYFFSICDSSDTVKFIWSSERENGYRHLFYVEKSSSSTTSSIKQLTTGEWCCVDKAIYVDEAKDLVYFSAKKDTPLETHFYVCNYKQPHEPRRLTALGFSHTVTMNSPDYFVDCYSTLHTPQSILVHNIKESTSALLYTVPLLKRPIDYINNAINKQNGPSSTSTCTELITNFVPNGEIFNFTTCDGKFILLYFFLSTGFNVY